MDNGLTHRARDFDKVCARRQLSQNGDGFGRVVADLCHQYLCIGRGDDDVVVINDDKTAGFTGLHAFEPVGNELQRNFQIQDADRRAILPDDAAEGADGAARHHALVQGESGLRGAAHGGRIPGPLTEILPGRRVRRIDENTPAFVHKANFEEARAGVLGPFHGRKQIGGFRRKPLERIGGVRIQVRREMSGASGNNRHG